MKPIFISVKCSRGLGAIVSVRHIRYVMIKFDNSAAIYLNDGKEIPTRETVEEISKLISEALEQK